MHSKRVKIIKKEKIEDLLDAFQKFPVYCSGSM
jgi:hypothetical protein